ncbi:MAG: DUF4403 family protein [Cytophagales bacterium]|nr:MAG: DUF4403 family protein [Cytophagales bacterium]
MFLEFNKIKSIISLLFVFLAFACSKKAIKSNYSEKNNTKIQQSIIYLPLKINNKLIETKINEYLPKILYRDSTMEDDNYEYTITKLSKPEISSADSGFQVSIMVHLDAKGKFDISGFGGTFPVTADLKPTLLFIPKISKNWDLNFDVQWLDHEWITKPTVQLGFFSMDVSGMADKILIGHSNKINTILSNFLNNKINIKPKINDFWEKSKNPILISEENKLWYHLMPDSLVSSQIFNKQGYMQILLKLTALPEINTIVIDPNNLKSLNDYKEIKEQQSDFKLFVDAKIKHNLFDDLAKKQLLNQTYTISENKKVTISDLKFKNIKEKLAIDFTVSGDYNGKLTILGNPIFDENTTEIILDNPNFEVNTKNKLHKAAAWLGKGKILKSMLPFLKFSVKQHLTDVKQNLTSLISNNKIENNLKFNGKIKNIMLNKDINVTDSTYIFNYIIKGELSAEFIKIDF